MRELNTRRLLLSSLALVVGAAALFGAFSHAASSATRMAVSATPRPTLAPPPTPTSTVGRPATIISPAPPPLPTLGIVRPPEVPGPMPRMMSEEEQRSFGISNASDVTGDPSVVTPAPAITHTEAVRIAGAHVAFEPRNARILRAAVRRFSDQAERSVWVILFGGGELPVLGPAGRPTQPPTRRTFTGVVVDDVTGAVLTWFMR